LTTTTLGDQEIARRESLERIKELGIDPFPPEAVDINFHSADFSSADYRARFEAGLTGIVGVDAEKAGHVFAALARHRFQAERLLENAEQARDLGLEAILKLDDGSAVGLNEYIAALRETALGDYAPERFPRVKVAGRFMGARGPFAKLQDAAGQLQLYLQKGGVGDSPEEKERNEQLVKLLDIGDFIAVEGYLFATQTGELTLHVESLRFLAKALRPLPIVKRDKQGNVYDAFTDPEQRYRQRYVDLVVNPEVRDIFARRSRLISAMRRFFDQKGWLEVETPVLQPIHGGAAARPFITHHHTLDIPLYLRIANELYLKRLIVGGYEGVYEIGKMFRNEGMDRTHNPEFTALEIYVAYKDYHWMMDMVERLLEQVAREVNGDTKVNYEGKIIDFKGPYHRLTMYEAIQEYTGEDISTLDEDGLRALCRRLHIPVDQTMGRGKLIDELFSEKVEAHLVQPTYIMDYPLEMTPLAKKHRQDKNLVERFELFVNGKEIANAYSELNDPIDQRERFEEQLRLAARGDEEAMALDEDFLRALEYGMPPTSGLGIGIDRLCMLFTNQHSIQEVLFFPQMKPERRGGREQEQEDQNQNPTT
jgi:lysyl-tRNA synthetase class 2